MSEMTQAPVTGAVIFLDIDRYLDFAAKWTATAEYNTLSNLQNAILIIAANKAFHLPRTLGYGFLLYSVSAIDDVLKQNLCSLLLEIAKLFRKNGLTVRGSFATGNFIVQKRSISVQDLLREHDISISEKEVTLFGPVVNYAGKLLRLAPPDTVVGAWRTDENDFANATYESMVASDKSFEFWKFDMSQALNENIRLEPEIIKKDQLDKINHESDSNTQAIFSGQIKSFILDTTKIADEKAKNCFGIAAALVVFLFNYAESGFYISKTQINIVKDFSFVVELSSIFFLVLACIFSFCTFVPRLQTKFSRGLAFFGSIAAWTDPADYLSALKLSSNETLVDELTRHNYEISKVSVKKFRYLSVSLWCLALGIFFMFLRFVLLRL